MTELKGKQLSWAVWAAAGLAISTFGFNQSALGNLVRLPSFYEQFPQINSITTVGAEKAHKSTIEGTVVALYTLFGAIGGLTCMLLGDVLGRKKTILLANVVQGIGYVLMSSSYAFAQLIVARIVLGLGSGALIATVSAWQAELSRPRSRGAHVSAFGMFAGFGGAVGNWLEYGMQFDKTTSASWRVALAFPLVFTIALAVLMCFLPESPHWLIKKKREAEAKAILERVRADWTDTAQEDSVEQTVFNIQQASHAMSNRRVPLSSLFTMGDSRVFHRLCLACGAQFFLQANGTNAVVYYTTTIFQAELHFSLNLSYILAGCLAISITLAALICSFTVDRFGRRKLMLFGAALCSVSMACLAGTASASTNKAALKAAVFFVFSFKFFFTIGWLGIPFLYAAEVAPDDLRTPVCGIATAVGWLLNFLIAEVSPIAFTKIGNKYFIVFAVTNAVSALTIYFFYPETNGCTLEEIDIIFMESKSVFDTVAVARRFPLDVDTRTAIENGKTKPGMEHVEFLGAAGEKAGTTLHVEETMKNTV